MKKIDYYRKNIADIDNNFASLFDERMSFVDKVLEYKLENNLPIYDKSVEEDKLCKASKYFDDEELNFYYTKFVGYNMNLSKMYQSEKASTLEVFLDDCSYEIVIKNNVLDNISSYLDLDRKVLLISDNLVPSIYLEKIKKNIKESYTYIINHGEDNKSLKNYECIMSYLLEHNFSRKDVIIAVGGGVVGDLSAFMASTYKRGIDFYNIPTTLLAMIDSSIGGKTAINFGNYKNMIGSFYQPKKVIIDPTTLLTLSKRELHAGLVEAIKMGATSDASLFELIENSNDIYSDIEEIIKKALLIKKKVVMRDPLEKNIRKVLNFGHTVGHAIESLSDFKLLHGECVGIGMLYFSFGTTRNRIKKLLEKYDLPTSYNFSYNELLEKIKQDKKIDGNKISIIEVQEIGSYEIKDVTFEELKKYF